MVREPTCREVRKWLEELLQGCTARDSKELARNLLRESAVLSTDNIVLSTRWVRRWCELSRKLLVCSLVLKLLAVT